MENDRAAESETDSEKPPVLSSWNRVYAVVFLNLVALIVLFYLFTRMFR